MKKCLLVIILLIIMTLKVSALEKVEFNRCIDGDTVSLKINGKVKRVRMLAIDTPESVTPEKPVGYYGVDASKFTCNLMTDAHNIYLEYDDNSDREDKYGRVLAYVYADDVMVQRELLKYGYAKVAYLYGDYKYTSEFKELERVAKENKLGIWIDEVDRDKTFFELLTEMIMKITNALTDLSKSVL